MPEEFLFLLPPELEGIKIEAALEAGVSGGPGGETGLNFAGAGFVVDIGAGADSPRHKPALLTFLFGGWSCNGGCN